MRHEAVAALIGCRDGECRLAGRVSDVAGTVVGLGVVDRICKHVGRSPAAVSCGSLGVDVDYAEPARWQRLYQLELCACDVFDRAERFEVHLAHRRYDADRGMNQLAYLAYVAALLGAHFDDEYVVVGFELLAYGAHHAEGGVVVARCHQDVVLLREYAVQEVLGRGLAEAARNTDDRKPGHRTQNAACVVIVPARDGTFDGTVYKVEYDDPALHGQQHGHAEGPVRCV
ncbi:hypothetical protein IMSAGC022_01324 [Alistipes sp.]|nr:hypothetical protein IMSAGC022_01324 [Alistipes sp.]